MNGERLAGIYLQITGKINQAWGGMIGDPLRVAAARRDEIMGKVQQACAIEQVESARQLRDFQHLHRNWHF
jgi:uncharacterized protein YjbJ (UPF0337 family)